MLGEESSSKLFNASFYSDIHNVNFTYFNENTYIMHVYSDNYTLL